MTTTTANKNARTIVASASNAAGGTTRGTLDLRTAHGATVTVKLTNGATGPTVPCTCNILIAHSGGATPAAASAGADWKTLWSFAGVVTNSGIVEQSIAIDASIMHMCIEFTGNTGQAVIVEAFASETTSYTSV